MAADDRQFLYSSAERQNFVGIFEQHNRLFRIRLTDGGICSEVDGRHVYRMIHKTLGKHSAQDAKDHIVKTRLTDMAVFHRLFQRAAEIMRLIKLRTGLLVEP